MTPTPTPPAAPVTLPDDIEAALRERWGGKPIAPLHDRIDEAIRRITNGHGSMRIPAEPTDPDLVLSDCRKVIDALQSSRDELAARVEAMEAVVEAVTPIVAAFDDEPTIESAVSMGLAMNTLKDALTALSAPASEGGG